MTETSGIQYGSGFRYGAAFAIDQTTGRLKGNSATTAYEGIQFVGAKAWNLTIPKQRKINHISADRVAAVDFLPPTEAASGTINVGADNMVLDEVLTGNKRVTIADATTISVLTSNQGYEPFIALLLWQQSEDYASRLRRWRTYLIPRAKAIPMDSGFTDKEVDGSYDVLMTPSNTNIFGVNLTTAIDGATDAQLFKAMTYGRPKINAYIGDNYVVDFFYMNGGVPVTGIDVASVAVYKNGVALNTGFTATTSKVTFDVAPLTTDDINLFFQY